METPINKMTKDQLEEYALAEFGVEINKTEKVDVLREQVAAMAAKPQPGLKNVDLLKKIDNTHFKHPVTQIIYQSTPYLAARGDLIACDKKGNPV